MLDEAKRAEVPRRLTGATRRRILKIEQKEKHQWTETENLFMEFVEYVREARAAHYEKRGEENRSADPPKTDVDSSQQAEQQMSEKGSERIPEQTMEDVQDSTGTLKVELST